MPTSTKKRPAARPSNRLPKRQRVTLSNLKASKSIAAEHTGDSGTSDNSASEEVEEEEEDNDDDEQSIVPNKGLSGDNTPLLCFNPLITCCISVTKNAHVAQRVLTQQRRAAKPHSTLLADAKRAWSLARQKTISKEERASHIASLMDIVRGKIQDIVFKHDASRIVQTIVKWGKGAQRDEVAAELRGRFKELVENKYSKFLVAKLARFCPSHRLSMIMEFRSHVVRLLLHREASQVIADIYELHANATERAILLRDFYGREAALLPLPQKITKDEQGVFLQGASEEQRKRILTSLRENLELMINKSDKGPLRHVIVHRAFWEYLSEIAQISDDREREKMYYAIFESCKDLLAEMVHTKHGSRVVREFLARGTAKDRKHIVKVLKPYITTMAQDEDAQYVLFTAFDVIDDTKLIAKSILPSITLNAKLLQASAAGRRTLLYMLLPRDRRYYTPSMIARICETDSLRVHTSKKSGDVRIAEICSAASSDLVSWVVRDGAEVSRETGGSLVITEIMLEAHGDKEAAMEALLSPLSAPYPSNGDPHPIDLPHTSRLYKILLQGGHFSQVTNAVVTRPHYKPSTFATAFLRYVKPVHIVAMARDGGAFVIAALLERVAVDGTPEERAGLEECLSGLKGDEGGSIRGRGWAALSEGLGALESRGGDVT
ncbi:armadillo-type protein [Russula earlei]|uniref:Armadillo-type protein n=1 Tax=Russula earlei TaxID=71964 RepID=A0ACC0U599_9AGAM|nr:armadillo-type protein [Russula earlei]